MSGYVWTGKTIRKRLEYATCGRGYAFTGPSTAENDKVSNEFVVSGY